MAKINLRELYPFYGHDCYIEVTDELAEALATFERAEEAYKRKLRRNKAFYSLNREDGIEHKILFAAPSIEELFEQKLTRNELHAAISTLPDKQAKRIYAHFLLGMKKSDIAKAEGISWHSVDKSIRQGLVHLAKKLKNLR